jgi:hypothetical protein
MGEKKVTMRVEWPDFSGEMEMVDAKRSPSGCIDLVLKQRGVGVPLKIELPPEAVQITEKLGPIVPRKVFEIEHPKEKSKETFWRIGNRQVSVFETELTGSGRVEFTMKVWSESSGWIEAMPRRYMPERYTPEMRTLRVVEDTCAYFGWGPV